MLANIALPSFLPHSFATLIGILAGLIPISMGLSAIGLEAHPVVTSTAMQTAFFGGMMPTEWMNVGSAAAWIVMLIPFWLGSVWIERRTLTKRLPDCEPSRISSAVVRGNLTSYSLFLIFGVITLSSAIADLPNQKQHFKEFREHQETYRNQLDEQGEQNKTTQHSTSPESNPEDNSSSQPKSEVLPR